MDANDESFSGLLQHHKIDIRHQLNCDVAFGNVDVVVCVVVVDIDVGIMQMKILANVIVVVLNGMQINARQMADYLYKPGEWIINNFLIFFCFRRCRLIISLFNVNKLCDIIYLFIIYLTDYYHYECLLIY